MTTRKKLEVSQINKSIAGSELEGRMRRASSAVVASRAHEEGASADDPSMTEYGSRVGDVPGIRIWRIENLIANRWPQDRYGSFYDGDSYLVLSNFPGGKGGKWKRDVYYWLGKYTSVDEAAIATYKALELGDILNGEAVQHREVQGHESPTFLALFPNSTLKILHGGIDSGLEDDAHQSQDVLFHVSGPTMKTVRVEQCESKASSLSEGDCYVLVTEKGMVVYVFQGASSSPGERSRASLFAKSFSENLAGSRIIVVSSHDAPDLFWASLGGRCDIQQEHVTSPRASDTARRKRTFSTARGGPPKLYVITDNQFSLVAEGTEQIQKETNLDATQCYVLYDAQKGDEGKAYVWTGSQAKESDRKDCMASTQSLLNMQGNPTAPVEVCTEGAESCELLGYLKPDSVDPASQQQEMEIVVVAPTDEAPEVDEAQKGNPEPLASTLTKIHPQETVSTNLDQTRGSIVPVSEPKLSVNAADTSNLVPNIQATPPGIMIPENNINYGDRVCFMCSALSAVNPNRPPNPGRFFCKDCDDSFCEECWEREHRNPRRHHHNKTLLFFSCTYCGPSNHAPPAVYFCSPCDVYLCVQCWHDEHRVSWRRNHTKESLYPLDFARHVESSQSYDPNILFSQDVASGFDPTGEKITYVVRGGDRYCVLCRTNKVQCNALFQCADCDQDNFCEDCWREEHVNPKRRHHQPKLLLYRCEGGNCPPNTPALQSCTNCDLYLCDVCWKVEHRNPRRKSHGPAGGKEGLYPSSLGYGYLPRIREILGSKGGTITPSMRSNLLVQSQQQTPRSRELVGAEQLNSSPLPTRQQHQQQRSPSVEEELARMLWTQKQQQFQIPSSSSLVPNSYYQSPQRGQQGRSPSVPTSSAPPPVDSLSLENHLTKLIANPNSNAASGSPARTQHAKEHNVDVVFRQRLSDFYHLYNPDKLPEVVVILSQYKGHEDVLFESLTKKYGPEPGPAEKASQIPLPAGWIVVESERGDIFYKHIDGRKQWRRPY